MNLKCLFYVYLFLITIKEKIYSLFQRTQQTLHIVEIYRGDHQFFTYFKGRDARSAVVKKIKIDEIRMGGMYKSF